MTDDCLQSQLFSDGVSLRLLFLLGALLDHHGLQIAPVVGVFLLQFLELEEVLWGKLAEFAALVFQDLLELVDLELAELWDGLDDAPLLVTSERDASAEEREEQIHIEVGFRMRRNHDVLVGERARDRTEAVVGNLCEDLNVFLVVTHFFGGNRSDWRGWRSGILHRCCTIALTIILSTATSSCAGCGSCGRSRRCGKYHRGIEPLIGNRIARTGRWRRGWLRTGGLLWIGHEKIRENVNSVAFCGAEERAYAAIFSRNLLRKD